MKKNSKTQLSDELSILLDSIQGISWTTDSETISKFSKDLFYSSKKSDVIIQPRGTSEIIRVIQAIQSSKFKIAVRGGGLSYSAGYLAARENTVLLDMRLCDQIIQINADDMFAIVGAGTTLEKTRRSPATIWNEGRFLGHRFGFACHCRRKFVTECD